MKRSRPPEPRGPAGAAREPRYEALAGTLLGTAVGDALGLPCEGLDAGTIARRFMPLDRYRLLGSTGYVSDDTELAALAAQSLASAPDDPERCAAAFRRALALWALRLPWGLGLATLRAAGKALLGFSRTGVASAGNGACTRAPIVGVVFASDPSRRRAFGLALARVTHTDERAVQAALFAAETAARASQGEPADACLGQSLGEARDLELRAAIEDARDLAERGATVAEAAAELGNTGYSVHTCALAAFCWARFPGAPLAAIQAATSAGGDTDSIAALVGAWCGAAAGESGLPQALVARLCGGPFGSGHLRALARALDSGEPPPGYAWPAAMLRNLALMPVILGHGLRRLFP